MSKHRVSLPEYYDHLKTHKIPSFRSENRNNIWVKHESLSAVRFPEFATTKPDNNEIRRIFRALNCIVVNYTSKSEEENQNAYLYICSDKGYTIDKLESSSVRRNIRYAQRHLNCGFTEWENILGKGHKAFSDTRTRVGLSDGNLKNFHNRFKSFSNNPAHKAIAAWLGDQLIAFLSIIEVDDFVIIQGTFSTDEHRSLKPNNLLIDYVLSYYLTQQGFSTVCYGLSSIQENTNKDSLHSYKIQVGFDAVPVQRMFVFHPLIKFLQPLLFVVLKLLLLILPHNRYIRKAFGLLNNA